MKKKDAFRTARTATKLPLSQASWFSVVDDVLVLQGHEQEMALVVFHERDLMTLRCLIDILLEHRK